jgi:hypothetical protein
MWVLCLGRAKALGGGAANRPYRRTLLGTLVASPPCMSLARYGGAGVTV